MSTPLRARNPFGLTRQGLDSLWAEQQRKARSASAWFGWGDLQRAER